MEIKDFTENRHGFLDSDLDTLPRERIYRDEEEAVAAMAGNRVAFRLYFKPDSKQVNFSVLATFHRVERAKKSARFRSVATCLASCPADAYAQLDADFGPLVRVLSATEWIALQTKQHLRSLGHA